MTVETGAERGSLILRGVSKTYGDFTAVAPTDLEVPDGEFLALLGPSGSGKTTVLRLIGGFVRPSTGHVFLDGQDITDLPIFDRPCNTVFQDYALFPHMRVRDNIAFGLSVRHRPRSEIGERVEKILASVGLESLKDRYPSQLSGGQRQRVALARAMICEPRLILLDEPLAALDANLRQQMQEQLKSIQRALQITFVFVTHDQSEAIAVADRIAVMNAGRIEQIATPTDLYYRPQTPFVADFFGENNLLPGQIAMSGSAAMARTAIGDFPVPADQPVVDAADCVVAVRPEILEVSAAPPPETANGRTVPGRVAQVLFGGPQTRVTFVPDAATDLTVICLVPSQDVAGPYANDEPAFLNIPDTYAVVSTEPGHPKEKPT
ncbi:MAG: ABC transporter ATP-binding protein [Hyphomicrobiales bacterium]|nr:ABC transporter ATP-binding protein [Hyphomicrobiales bacterium]